MMWEQRLKAFARIIHGVTELLVFGAQTMTGGPSNLRTFIGLVVVGPLVALLLSRLWNDPAEGKEIAVFLAVSSLAIGTAAVYGDSLLVARAKRVCEVAAGNSRSLEIVEYPEIGWNPQSHRFLIIGKDEGSWRQIMHIGPISQATGCGTLGVFDENFFWYWIGWKLAVTHDGGETWETWDINDLFPEWRCCEARRIDNVEFRDEVSGLMHGSFDAGQANQLVSQDGGITWAVP
jgi:hypothetical protein